jgi:predicted protein tyrosine phosphatase
VEDLAGKLKAVSLDVGAGGDPLNVVTNAPNVAEGQRVVVATVGSVVRCAFQSRGLCLPRPSCCSAHAATRSPRALAGDLGCFPAGTRAKSLRSRRPQWAAARVRACSATVVCSDGPGVAQAPPRLSPQASSQAPGLPRAALAWTNSVIVARRHRSHRTMRVHATSAVRGKRNRRLVVLLDLHYSTLLMPHEGGRFLRLHFVRASTPSGISLGR